METEQTTSVADILGTQTKTETTDNIEGTTTDTAVAVPDGYVALPTEKSTPEEVSAFYGKLGRPETAEQYKLAVPDGYDDSFPKAMAPIMFSAGITQEQASKLAEGWNGFIAAKQTELENAYEAAQEKEMGELRKEWGADYDKNEEIARQAARKYGLGDAELTKMEHALGSKALMNLMYKIGSTIMDGEIKGVNGSSVSPAAYTAEQAQAKLDELKADKEFGAKFMAGDKEARKLFDDLCMAVSKGE